MVAGPDRCQPGSPAWRRAGSKRGPTHIPGHLFKWGGTTSQHLFSAEFTADIAGEHSRWKQACAPHTGGSDLVGAADSTQTRQPSWAEGLSALRRSGDGQSLKKAIRRLRTMTGRWDRSPQR